MQAAEQRYVDSSKQWANLLAATATTTTRSGKDSSSSSSSKSIAESSFLSYASSLSRSSPESTLSPNLIEEQPVKSNDVDRRVAELSASLLESQAAYRRLREVLFSERRARALAQSQIQAGCTAVSADQAMSPADDHNKIQGTHMKPLPKPSSENSRRERTWHEQSQALINSPQSQFEGDLKLEELTGCPVSTEIQPLS